MIIDFKSKKWASAVSRAVSSPRLVRLGFAATGCCCYKIRRSDGARFASVVVSVVGSRCAASCNCIAAFNGQLCYHAATAVLYHAGLVKSGARRPLSPVRFAGSVYGDASASPFFLLVKVQLAIGRLCLSVRSAWHKMFGFRASSRTLRRADGLVCASRNCLCKLVCVRSLLQILCFGRGKF